MGRVYTETRYCVYPEGVRIAVPFYSSTNRKKAEAKLAEFQALGRKVELRVDVLKLEDFKGSFGGLR